MNEEKIDGLLKDAIIAAVAGVGMASAKAIAASNGDKIAKQAAIKIVLETTEIEIDKINGELA